MTEKKPVLISIDTEGPCGKDPIKHLIYGETESGVKAGIGKLMDIFDNNGVKGLFFVDIAEAWDYDKKKIEGVLQFIKKRGHDTGVHIHPDHMADIKRKYLWQYTLEEQRNMIIKCTQFYKECLKETPFAFRAGRYGVNCDTLKILDELGYKYDMSEFYGNRHCHITPEITCNKIVKYKNLIEIPVTVYKSFQCPIYERFDKVDVSMDKGEFKRVVNRMFTDNSVDIISLFVHSFSLLDWRTNCNSPTYMEKEAKKLDFMIKYMKKIGYQFISLAELNELNAKNFDENDITDYSDEMMSFVYFIRRILRVVKMRLENNI